MRPGTSRYNPNPNPNPDSDSDWVHVEVMVIVMRGYDFPVRTSGDKEGMEASAAMRGGVAEEEVESRM